MRYGFSISFSFCFRISVSFGLSFSLGWNYIWCSLSKTSEYRSLFYFSDYMNLLSKLVSVLNIVRSPLTQWSCHHQSGSQGQSWQHLWLQHQSPVQSYLMHTTIRKKLRSFVIGDNAPKNALQKKGKIWNSDYFGEPAKRCKEEEEGVGERCKSVSSGEKGESEKDGD